MKAFLLSGNSIKNKSWIEDLNEHIKDLFDSTEVQYYKHWQTGEPIADAEYETNVLINKTDQSDFIIVAKSLGTYISLNAITEGIKPKCVILFGFPYTFLVDKGYEKNTKKILKTKIPKLFIQNENDPYCSFDNLSSILEENKIENYKTFKFPNNTHDYLQFPKIKELISAFISKPHKSL